MAKARTARDIVGTCGICGEKHRVLFGKLVEHTRVIANAEFQSRFANGQPARVRCFGSGSSSTEKRGRDGARRRNKRLQGVLSVRGEASVLLDALINKRADLDGEFDKAKRESYMRLAFQGYRLETGVVGHNVSSKSAGTFWRALHRDSRYDLFCRFCGHLIAQLKVGAWMNISDEDRTAIIGNHVERCALEYLSGLRTIVAPGTMKNPVRSALTSEYGSSDGPVVDPDAPPYFRVLCPTCITPVGWPCVAQSTIDHFHWSEMAIIDQPHEDRVVAGERFVQHVDEGPRQTSLWSDPSRVSRVA